MQGIFQKENTDKALKYGIYRHLPTYEKIIRNLVSFYKQKDNIFNICEIFSNALECMIQNDPKEIYIATLYFDTCVFKEETHSASFCINKEKFAKKLKVAINTYTKELNSPITFDNGMTKKFPMKNIENFNKNYISKYNFSIL